MRRPFAHRSFTSTVAVIIAIAAFLSVVAAQTPNTQQRVIAIGDIHGSYEGLVAILKRTGLVDDQLKWAGGRAVLVQTGDYTDRGTDVRKVMDLLMQLEKEAPAAGGQAIVLAGNHEIMNVLGDFRDVTPEICATFATPQSETHREEAWKRYDRIAQPRVSVMPSPAAVYAHTRGGFMTTYPPGCVEYREAMSPTGVYGKWIRAKDIATVVGDTLFMHAGINPSKAPPKSIAAVNDQVRTEVRRVDTYRKRLTDRRFALDFFGLQDIIDVSVIELNLANEAIATAKIEGKEPPSLDLPLLKDAQNLLEIQKWSVIDPEGPLWFRGYATWPEDKTFAQVNAFLDQMKLTRIVVAHTPTTERRIVTRYGGRVVTIDTGMLASYYKGIPSALEIVGTRMKAIYPDGEVELTPAKAARMSAPTAAPSSTHASRPAALATAKLMP